MLGSDHRLACAARRSSSDAAPSQVTRPVELGGMQSHPDCTERRRSAGKYARARVLDVTSPSSPSERARDVLDRVGCGRCSTGRKNSKDADTSVKATRRRDVVQRQLGGGSDPIAPPIGARAAGSAATFDATSGRRRPLRRAIHRAHVELEDQRLKTSASIAAGRPDAYASAQLGSQVNRSRAIRTEGNWRTAMSTWPRMSAAGLGTRGTAEMQARTSGQSTRHPAPAAQAVAGID